MPRFATVILLALLPVLAAFACSACDTSSSPAAVDAGFDDAQVPTTYVCGEPPSHCLARQCITQVEHFSMEDCCDSMQCNCDPSTKEWETWYCDPPAPPDAGLPDAAIAPPDAGGADAAP